jgi:hypothetical protein
MMLDLENHYMQRFLKLEAFKTLRDGLEEARHLLVYGLDTTAGIDWQLSRNECREHKITFH